MGRWPEASARWYRPAGATERVPIRGRENVACERLDQVNVTTSLQRALLRLGLPHRRFHDLRHTFATLALEAGEPLETVSRALGHTSLATTRRHLRPLEPVMRELLAQRMDAVLGG